MTNIFSPVDLRKIGVNEFKKAKTYLLEEPKPIFSSLKVENFQNDESTDFYRSDIFTENYLAPHVYISEIEDCIIGPRVEGFSRYWPFLFDNFYVWNFLNPPVRSKYEEKGVFLNEGEKIIWEKERFPTLRIPGLSIWFYPFGNLDHFLRECLPSILLIKNLGINFSKIKFICQDIKKPFFEFLIELGIPSTSIVVTGNKWISCEKLMLPCFGSFGHLHTPTQYYIKTLEWVREALNIKNISCEKKIFVSRRNSKVRKILNEFVLEPGLKKRGFQIIEPGDFSIKEQIKIFNNSSAVVGAHGMGIANYGFAGNDSVLFEIMQTNYARVSYFRTCQLKNGRYFLYWINPVSSNFCYEDDLYGSSLIDKNLFFSALDAAC